MFFAQATAPSRQIRHQGRWNNINDPQVRATLDLPPQRRPAADVLTTMSDFYRQLTQTNPLNTSRICPHPSCAGPLFHNTCEAGHAVVP